MLRIERKEQCCGCTACFNCCPVKAIEMKPDEEGFLYPQIDKNMCIDCGLCERICPVLNKRNIENVTDGYIIRYKNDKIVRDSTSGGAFTAFASYFLSVDALVYGVGYGANMLVIHKKADQVNQIDEMRGSKFVQSYLGDIFQEIDTFLRRGRIVAFFGTPCQIAGLVSYLRKKPDNLFCIDFVCRGVASPMLWNNYVQMMQKKYGDKIVSAKFKNKTYGYHASTMKIDFANGKKWYGSGRVDPMMKAFVREMASRPSCSECAFKGVARISDITMFDCYQFSQITGLQDDDKGYTSILIHSEAGKKVFNKVKKDLICYSVPVDKLITKNGIMVCNSAKPSELRSKFYKLTANNPIDLAMNIVSPITKKDKIVEYAKKIAYRLGIIMIIKKIKKKEIIEISTTSKV